MRKLIRGGTVVSSAGESLADVLIDGEEIAAVGSFGEIDAEVIDASGCYVLPGLIDNHTHMAMPFGGTRSIDDYDTGTRAAAAGGTTCIVDFVIQQEGGGLRSSLEEWKERAEGAAHVDYGFHIAITQADEGTFADMAPMVEEEGIASFKVFLAYKGVLMIEDDLFLRVLETTRDLNALTMVHCENGHAIDVYVERALAAGQTDPIHHAHTRPEVLEAEATHRAVRFAELANSSVYIVHVTCGLAADEIAAGHARGVDVSAETCLQYLTNTIDDLERPDFEGARYVCSPPLREEFNQELLWTALRRGVLESVSTDHCPFNSEQKALGRGRLLEDPERPRDDPAPAREDVGPRRRGRPDQPQPARRHDLDRDRQALRAQPQGPHRAGDGRGHRRLRPGDAVQVLHGQLAHERRLRPVRGRELDRQRSPHPLPRRARLRPRRDPHAAGPRPIRAALARRARGGRLVSVAVDADRVLADLRGLAELTGGPDGARRVCWTDEWVRAREFLRSRLAELPVEVSVDEAGNLWAELEGESSDGFVIVGSHTDSVPAGGWLDGALGVFSAVEALRAQAEAGPPAVGLRLVDWADEEGARFGRSLFGSSACAGTLEVDAVRDLRDRDGERLEDVVAAHGVELERAHESHARLRGACAYLELHVEQGPVLESRGEPAATVLGTFGVQRHVAVFSGRAAHAGATPMHLRQDSFAAAARAALEIRDIGLRSDGGVCTVGGATSEPGVITAIAGRTEMLLDQRALDADVLARMLARAHNACTDAAAEEGCSGRAEAHLGHSADPVRRAADRAGAGVRPGGGRPGHGDPERPAA